MTAMPTIANAASTAPTPHKLFVNLPVENVRRSIDGHHWEVLWMDASAMPAAS